MEYNEIVEKIIAETPIDSSDIFDYNESPFFEEFDKTYKFYYEALERHAHYGIDPFLLFYFNNTSVNAAAFKLEDYFTVRINSGTVVYLITKFKEAKDILVGTGNDEYLEFEKSLNTTINELMYQKALHFTFYHEMAHLIQKSEHLEKGILERPEGKIEYSEYRHLLEIDADQFSSLCIGTHVVQYSMEIFGKNITPDQLKKLLVIICSAGLFYILSFRTNKEPIYYYENSHPHPVIRITQIVFHICGYCLQSLSQHGINLDLNIKDVVNECLQFTHNISTTKLNSDLVAEFQDIIGAEAENITDYIKSMRELGEGDVSLASFKWNQVASQNK